MSRALGDRGPNLDLDLVLDLDLDLDRPRGALSRTGTRTRSTSRSRTKSKLGQWLLGRCAGLDRLGGSREAPIPEANRRPGDEAGLGPSFSGTG